MVGLMKWVGLERGIQNHMLDFILQQLLLENSHMHFTEMSLSTVLFACLHNFRLLIRKNYTKFHVWY